MKIGTLIIRDERLDAWQALEPELVARLAKGFAEVNAEDLSAPSEVFFRFISDLREAKLDNIAWGLLSKANQSDKGVRAALVELYESSGLFYSAYKLDEAVAQRAQDFAPFLQSLARVTAYVPCFNAEKYLASVLEGIFAQSYPVSEVIVVDDGSTDNSRDIANQFGAKLITHEKNLGLAAARNTALKHAQGEFIAAIDSDTVPDIFWLERMLFAFESSRVAGAAGRLFESRALSVVDRWRERMMPQDYGIEKRSGVKPYGCNSLFRASALQEVGGYNPDYTNAYDDMDLGDRILKAGHETRYVPNALCRHLRSDTLSSVLTSCYNWRKPGYILADAYADTSRLVSKWIFATHCDVKDLRQLCTEGRGDLSFVSLLGIFHFCATDLLNYRDQHKTHESDMLVIQGALVFLMILGKLSDADQAVRDDILAHFLSVIRRADLSSMSQELKDAHAKICDMSFSPEELNEICALVGLGTTNESEILLVALQEISAQLSLSSEEWAEIQRSQQKLKTDAARNEPIDKLIVNLLQTPTRSSELALDVRKINASMQQCIETICGAQPRAVSFIFGADAQEDFAGYLSLELKQRIAVATELVRRA